MFAPMVNNVNYYTIHQELNPLSPSFLVLPMNSQILIQVVVLLHFSLFVKQIMLKLPNKVDNSWEIVIIDIDNMVHLEQVNCWTVKIECHKVVKYLFLINKIS